MCAIQLRKPTAADWPAILAQADAALPWDRTGNREWLENRKRFAGRRRHYLAQMVPSGEVVGYGAVEEGPEAGTFRVFVVTDPASLRAEVGEMLYERLAAELDELGAQLAWAREYARDRDIITFFAERGFVEHRRFTPAGYEEMVVMGKQLVEAL